MDAKRIINFRVFLFSALFVTAAIFCVYLFFTQKTLSFILFGLSILIIGLLFFLYRKDKIKIFGMVIISLCFIITTISSAITVVSYKNEVEPKTEGLVSGYVDEVIDSGLRKSLVIRDVYFNELPIEGKVMIHVSEKNLEMNLSECNEGDLVILSTELIFEELVGEEVNAYYYRLGVRYNCYVEAENLTVKAGSPDLFENIRAKMYDSLVSGLGDRYGTIAYGMVTGDKSRLDYHTRDYFSAAGISHILSVSGLHVMFLSSAVLWIMKKLKANRWASFALISAILLFYNALVGFTASVVRASIMCLCMQLSTVLGARNDTLNNLGLAVTIILLASPFSLFDAGFLLSVGAVLGIALFYKSVNSFLSTKMKYIPQRISKSFAVSLTAQIGIMPAMIYYFNSVSVYSIIINMILMPLLMVAFICVVALVLPVMIFDKLSFLLWIPKCVLIVIDYAAQLVSKLPFATVTVYVGGIVFLLFAAYFIISRYLMLDKKWICYLVSALYCVMLCIIGFIPAYKGVDGVFCTADYNQVTSVVRVEDEVFIVGDLFRHGNTEKVLSKIKAVKVKAIYLNSIDSETEKSIVSLSRSYKLNKIYLPGLQDYDFTFINSLGIEVCYLDSDQVSEDGFKLVFNKNTFIGYEYLSNNGLVLFASHEVKFNQSMSDIVLKYAMIRVFSYNNTQFSNLFIANYHNQYLEDLPLNYIAAENTVMGYDFSKRFVFEAK